MIEESRQWPAKNLLQCENRMLFSCNVQNCATSGHCLEESMKFTRQNPLQSYKVPHQLKFLAELLDNSYEFTEKLVALTKKYGATISHLRAQDVCLG